MTSSFAAEAVRAGAQDYLPKAKLEPPRLRRAIRCAMERQHERVALIEEKDNYYGIFDHLVEGIFRTTPDGHYSLANVALARIYGYDSPAELMASIKDIARKLYVEPGRREEFVRLMQEHDTLSGFESKIYRKDGTIIWISENCRAVRDAEGKLLYYEGTVEDITQRRQTEEALRGSESLYHSLVETMPQNVFRKDLRGPVHVRQPAILRALSLQTGGHPRQNGFRFFPEGAGGDNTPGTTSGSCKPARPTKSPRNTIRWARTNASPGSSKPRCMARTEKSSDCRAFSGTSREQAPRGGTNPPGQRRTGPQPRGVAGQKRRDGGKPADGARNPVSPCCRSNIRSSRPASRRSKARFNSSTVISPPKPSAAIFSTSSPCPTTRRRVFICDVTGHGVRAALVTAMIRALAEELKPLARDPGMFLRKLNSDLCSILKTTGSPMLTTAFYLVADWTTGVMRFANAGHPKPLLVRRSAGSVEPLVNVTGQSQPALGLFDDPPYQTTEVTLAPGDFVMLFTDGLYEVQGLNEELYSQERMMMDVRSLLSKSNRELFDELLEAIRAFSVSHEFDDDVCLVGMEFAPKPAAKF